MSQLMTMLLQAGALSPERAREARRHQVIFGDRIGTNLLALDYVDEETLARTLGALHGVPWAAGKAADTSPALTRLLPRQLASTWSATPAAVDEGAVRVFMIDPHNEEAGRALAAHYRRPIQPVVVCEARMWALLHKYYLVRRGMRAIKLDGAGAKRTTLVPRRQERQASSVSTTVEVVPSAATSPTPSPTPSTPSSPPSSPSMGTWGPREATMPDSAPFLGTPASSASSASGLFAAQASPLSTTSQAGRLTSMPATLPAPAQASPATSSGPVRTVDASWLGGAPAPAPASPGAQADGRGPMPTVPAALLQRTGALTDILPPLRPTADSDVPIVVAGTLLEEATEVITGELAPTEPTRHAMLSGFAEAELSLDDLETSAVKAPTGPGSAFADGAFAEVDLNGPDLEGADLEGADLEGADLEGPDLEGPDLDRDEPGVEAGETTPLDFNEAKGALDAVVDRNAIARIVLRYARSRVRRALLLTVQRAGAEQLAIGWDALGEGLGPGMVHDVHLSLVTPSALKLATETRSHVLGPLAPTAVHDDLVGLLGGAPPKTAFVMPIVARGEVVNLLYLDDGPGRFMQPDIGEVLILCQAINKSYATLLSRMGEVRASSLPGPASR